MSISVHWNILPRWLFSASDILNEQASEESGHSTDSVHWMDTVTPWRRSASEILNEQASEESGQSTDDF
ncbi:hypothetical protein L210DRAFT_949333 [Boletus edulis BED1]|uniref:Uncharacterized protein n=1 Tax=Boletus edulis BED1 TaxID=1328754 RepID=A0AAD4GH04_BOLED|nr:hypothetical protein L210DRAFT_949333 [Boletus edulis BED1]